MSEKMKECLKPHVLMHSLFGLGLGITLTALVSALSNFWLGVVLMVVAFALDYKRKS